MKCEFTIGKYEDTRKHRKCSRNAIYRTMYGCFCSLHSRDLIKLEKLPVELVERKRISQIKKKTQCAGLTNKGVLCTNHAEYFVEGVEGIFCRQHAKIYANNTKVILKAVDNIIRGN